MFQKLFKSYWKDPNTWEKLQRAKKKLKKLEKEKWIYACIQMIIIFLSFLFILKEEESYQSAKFLIFILCVFSIVFFIESLFFFKWVEKQLVKIEKKLENESGNIKENT